MQEPAIHLRDATREDADAIARLHTRSWREHNRGEFDDAFLDEALPDERIAVWRERLKRPPPEQLVRLACQGDALLGFVCAYGAEDPVWGSFVDNLHVATSAFRRGIGRALMREAGRWLAARHPERGVYLWVLASNATGRRFYEAIGAENAETTMTETHGGARVRSCRYVWQNARRLAGD